jgi:hypothetical protein
MHFSPALTRASTNGRLSSEPRRQGGLSNDNQTVAGDAIDQAVEIVGFAADRMWRQISSLETHSVESVANASVIRGPRQTVSPELISISVESENDSA